MYFLKHYFLSDFYPSVTLVTAKKQHRCWKARACAYTHAYVLCAREAYLFFICAVTGALSVVASALLRVGWCRASICYAGERNTCGVYCTIIPRECNMEVSKMMVFEIELSLFCDFFPLWGNIDPYTYRGASPQCNFVPPTQPLGCT